MCFVCFSYCFFVFGPCFTDTDCSHRLSMNGIRHTLPRELLVRMLVSALPLLVRLDLSIDVLYDSVGISVDTCTVVHIPELREPHPTTSFLQVLGGKFSHGIATLNLSGRTYFLLWSCIIIQLIFIV